MADSSGTVTLQLGQGGITTTMENGTYGGFDSGLNIVNSTSGFSTSVSSQGFLAFDTGNLKVQAAVSGGNGNLLLFDSGGTNEMALAPTSLSFNSDQVIGERITGWNTPSGSVIRGTFNTATATLAQLAETVGAMITDLRTHGLIGT